MLNTLNMPLKGMRDLSFDVFLRPTENPQSLECFTPWYINTFILQINVSEMTVFRPTLGRAYFAYKIL